MKTNFKRLFALALSLCLLASLMVPVAFAEDEAVAAPSANVAETYNVRLVDMTQLDHTNRTGWNTYFGGSSGYKSTGVKGADDAGNPTYNTTLINPINAAYADGTLDWKFLESKGEATYRIDRMMQLRSSGWVALQIRVSASGMYALNIATDKNDPAEGAKWTNDGKTQSGNVAAYIVPVADFSVENIDAIMVEENSVGTVYLSADATSVTFAKQRMEAGEYVVIYDGPSNYSVCEMSLLGDAYEMENVATYDMNPFDLTNTDITTWTGTVNEVLIPIVDGTSSNDYVTPGNSVDYATFGWASYGYSGTWRAQAAAKFDPCLKSAGNWAAIKLNVPASGEQYLSLTTDRMDVSAPFSNSFGKNITATVSAYLIPVAEVANKDAVAGLIEAGTGYIGTRSLFSTEDKTMTFDKAFLEAGEYILVVKLEAVKGGRYPISQISLDKVAGQDLPESEIVTGTVATYDFEIYNNERYAPIFTYEDGITTGGRSFVNGALSGLEGVYEKGDRVETIIAKDYAAGIINFKLKEFTCTSHTFEGDLTDTDTGLRIQKKSATEQPESQYMALTLNVPATNLYTVKLNASHNSVDTLNVYIYDADAEGTVAENMTEANLVATNATAFASVLTAGDNIIVFEIANSTGKETLRLTSITLSVPDTSATYSMDLLNNDALDAKLSEMTLGVVTEATAGNLRYREVSFTDKDGNAQTRLYYYNALGHLFVDGSLNWFPDTIQVGGAANDVTYSNYALTDGSAALRIRQEGDANDFAAIRIRVQEAGTYNININITCGKLDGVSAYIVPAPLNLKAPGKINSNVTQNITAAQALAAVVPENLLGNSASKAGPVTGTYCFEAAGEYVIILKHNNVDDSNMYLSSIVMEPVVYSYIADGVGYNTLEEALAKATEYVFMTQNTQADDLVVPAGVTLDLNGYTLYASSVDATAPGAQIIDSLDGKALLRGEVEFNENNAQLPLYDIDADGYYLFNVNVDAHATTGTGSATKYWFKVNFSNAKAYDLIGMNTELRIVANMTGVVKETGEDWAALATSTASFVNTWADNNTSYIVVSAVGSGISSFRFNPGVSANGVTISGGVMYKGSAT